MVPLNLAADIAGAVTRTVADTAAVLQAIAGEDPDDRRRRRDADTSIRTTRRRSGSMVSKERASACSTRRTTRRRSIRKSSDVRACARRAAERGRNHRRPGRRRRPRGDAASTVGRLQSIQVRPEPLPRGAWRQGADALARRHHQIAPLPPVDSGAARERRQAPTTCPGSLPGAGAATNIERNLRAGVLAVMDGQHLDALAYPTWSNPPRLIGDLNTPGGDNSQVFSPGTGYPAITVPMGFTRGGTLPAGLQLLRPRVERADAPAPRVRLRAGNASSPSARSRPATIH